jgi:hypothetical protein
MGQVSSLDASDNPLLAQNQSPPEQNGGQPLTSTTQNEQTTIQQPPPYVSNTNTSLGTTRKVAPVESAVHKQLMDAVSNVDLSATKRHIKNGANVEVTDRVMLSHLFSDKAGRYYTFTYCLCKRSLTTCASVSRSRSKTR